MEARKFIIDEEKVLQKLDDGTAPSDLLNTEVYADADRRRGFRHGILL